MVRRAVRSSGGLGLVGGQQWPQEPVVQLGVEDRGAEAVRGQDVVVGVLDPVDQPGEAEPPQVVGRLAAGVKRRLAVRSLRRAGSCW